MTKRLIILFFLAGGNAWAQETNEKLLFSFSTEQSETLKLTLDTVNNVMIYRFGRTNMPELEIRDDLNDSIPIFTYSYYFRGGGVDNAGLDLNYVTFVNKGYKYLIYYEYSAEEDNFSIGVSVKDINKVHISNIKGIYKTVQGSLVSAFRWDELIPTVDME